MIVRCPKCGRAAPWIPPDLSQVARGPEPTEELTLTPHAVPLWCVACSKGHWLRGAWVWTKRTFFVVRPRPNINPIEIG